MSDKQKQMDAMWDALENGEVSEREIATSVKAFQSESCRCGGNGYLDAADVDPRVFHSATEQGSIIGSFASVGAVICPDPACDRPRR